MGTIERRTKGGGGHLTIPTLLGLLGVLFVWQFYWGYVRYASAQMARQLMANHSGLPEGRERKSYRHPWIQDLHNQVLLVRFPGGMRTLGWGVTCLGLIGAYLGWLWFYSLPSILMAGLSIGVLPIVVLYMLAIRRQVKIRLSFLHAMEVFYQAYVSIPHRNIRVVVAKVVQEKRMPIPIRPLFQELNEQLIFGNKAALQQFASALHHEWGYTLTNLLAIGLEEGANLDEALQTFIRDLREAQASAWADRNRLLEIRFANFSPPLIVGLFIGVNFYMNPVAANQAYFHDLHGRILLMQSVILMVLSFAMGIWLSIRRT
jgi:Flp pilus assembly protein TadB